MLVSIENMLNRALVHQYAVGQFNINNLEWTGTVLNVAQKLRSPVILGVSGGTIKDVPVALHLDHGQSYEACEAAIKAGFSSVMFDGSHMPFAENLAITKRLVKYAHRRGVSVEAELGTIAGSEDGIVNSRVIYADPTECKQLVEETGVDCLAAALGSTHGLYKGKAKLGFAEMEHISQLVKVPLVLHGGTGISDTDMKKAISLGTAKINVNTENMYAWCLSVKEQFEHKGEHDINDPRKVITKGLQPVAERVAERMSLFGSVGQSL